MATQNPWGSSAIRNERWAVENTGVDEKKALKFEENARLPRLNECRSTSKSKQSVFPGFSTKKYTGRFDQKRQKATSKWEVQLYQTKIWNLYLVEMYVSYSHERSWTAIFGILR